MNVMRYNDTNELSINGISIYFDTFEQPLTDELHLKLGGETVSIICGSKATQAAEMMRIRGIQ